MPIEPPPSVYEQPTESALLHIVLAPVSTPRSDMAETDSEARKPRFITRFTQRLFGRRYD
jgi:hypothetical protein